MRQPNPTSPHRRTTSTAPGSGAASAPSPVAPLRVESTALMGGQRVLEIVHQGEVYRLQNTRFGKLILTK